MMLLSLFTIFLIELIARTIYPETRLDKITKIIEPHSKRFWRGKPNYQGIFFDAMVKHNSLGLRSREDISKTDILVLGASPSYGWGVEYKKIYSSLIEEKLKVRVTNASNIGYTSFQGKLLLNDLLSRTKPKIVIIAYVINDGDRYRFFSNGQTGDREVIPSRSMGIQQFIERNYYTGKLIRNLLKPNDYLPLPGKIRVNNTDYEDNISKMISAVKDIGSTPILLKMPVMLHENTLSENFVEFLKKYDCYDDLDSDEKLYSCLTAHKNIWNDGFSQNELRKVMAMNSSRRTLAYHEILDKLAEDFQIPIVNAIEKFALSPDYLFLHKNIDPIHPNEKGHEVISKMVIDEIRSKDLF
jgi:lysophospholipase L1-like esterase